MNINLSEKERFYLRRYAALQFPGSVDNYSTRNPIHFLEEKAGEYIPVPMDEFGDDEVALIEYGYDNSYHSVEELVADALCLDCHNDEEIKVYNKEAAENAEIQFITFEKAQEDGHIPGFENTIYDVEDYLKAYGIDTDEVSFYRLPDSFEVKAISFTHKGAEEMEQDMANHISRPTRFYAFTTCDGDFPVMMNFMYRVGKAALDEETEGYKSDTIFQMSENEIRENLQQNPNKSFDAAKFNIGFPAPRAIGDVEVKQVCLTVTIKGTIREIYGNSFPIATISVKLDAQAFHKECQYPFECDRYLEALKKDENIITMFNYIMYR